MPYTINSTKQVPWLPPGADQPISVMRVYITTSRGSSGFVEVGMDDWTTENLREILEAKAAELDLAFSIAS